MNGKEFVKTTEPMHFHSCHPFKDNTDPKLTAKI